MNCFKCNAALPEGSVFCHVCGTQQTAPMPPQGGQQTQYAQPQVGSTFQQAAPADAGNILAFIQRGKYTLKGKMNGCIRIISGGQNIGLLQVSETPDGTSHIYDLVPFENAAPVYRFIRTDTTLSCVHPMTNQVFFTWQRQSTAASELLSGCKWSCGPMNLFQSSLRSLFMWIPNISWFIPTKYSITEAGRCVGMVAGAAFSFSNSKMTSVQEPSKALEIFAAAIILSDDELG